MSLLLLVLLIVLFFAVLSLHCCVGFSLGVANVGYSLAVGPGPLTVVASLVVEPQAGRHELQQLWHMGSIVAALGRWSTASVVRLHGLSCSMACGIFLDQE